MLSGTPTAMRAATSRSVAASGVMAPTVPAVSSRASTHLVSHLAASPVPALPSVRRADVTCASSVSETAKAMAQVVYQGRGDKPMKVIIAGAGIGGLVLAVALLKQGFEVQVFERDLTAIRGEGKYRGPIQVQSNALAALEAIDAESAQQIFAAGCITGDRINGLCDGLTGEWYVKFDTFATAAEKGLPVTRVVSRVELQEILARAVTRYGGSISNGCNVVSYEDLGKEVNVTLEDGRVFTGDLLVGTDGIWSKVRRQLIGHTEPNYSGYTCYTGISDFVPADIDVVGYRVFLGNGQYFVSSDVGGGKMQWYGFHKEPAGGTDTEGQRKARLLSIFGHWNDNVVDLIKATPEEDVLRRDIFDRPPIFQWAKGRVALLGDSAHAMQPNLGQGGCMAIEDAYEMAIGLSKAVEQAKGDASAVDVPAVLRDYQSRRLVRVSVIHGMAGLAAFMASTYKCYLGEPWSEWVQQLRIPHPGRVAGRIAMLATFPYVLGWVLGGNTENVAPHRVSSCSLGDKPKAFEVDRFGEFFADDGAIINAASEHADWLLLAERSAASKAAAAATSAVGGARGGTVPCALESAAAAAIANSSAECKGVYVTEKAALVGRSGAESNPDLAIEDDQVAERHAMVWRVAPGASPAVLSQLPPAVDGKPTPAANYFLKDLGSGQGTWLNGSRVASGATVRLWPGDVVEFGRHPSAEAFKVKMQHVTLRTEELSGSQYSTLLVGKIRDPVEAAQRAAAEREKWEAIRRKAGAGGSTTLVTA